MLRDLRGVVQEALYQWWFLDNIFQHGAAISYYAVFALSPLVVIAVAIAGAAYGPEAAEGELAERIEHVTGETIAQALQETIRQVHASGTGRLATGISIGLLVIGAMGVFSQLQETLNTIWHIKPRVSGGIKGLVRRRFVSFLMVVVMGGFLLTAVAATTSLGWLGEKLQVDSWPGGRMCWRGVHWTISIMLLTIVFATIYKLLPDVRIAWRVVWPGSLATALLFTAGNYLIGLYLSHSSTASAFGAAGSLIVVLAWVYYSSQVVLLGAELTEAYARKYGGVWEPGDSLELPLQTIEK